MSVNYLELSAGEELDLAVETVVMNGKSMIVPSYSTSLDDAFLILDSVNNFTVVMSLSSRLGDDWRLIKTFQYKYVLEYKTPSGMELGPVCDTPALAICQAALRIAEVMQHGAKKGDE